MIQAAFVGLADAIARFDPAKAGKFSTYAVWWMRHHCQDAARRRRVVHLPSDLMKWRRRVERVEAKHSGLSDDELCERLGIPPVCPTDRKQAAEWRQRRRLVREARTMYAGVNYMPIDFAGHTSRAVQRAAELEQPDIEPEMHLDLRSALARLPPLQRAVLADEFDVEGPEGALLPTDPVALAQLRDIALRRLRLLLKR